MIALDPDKVTIVRLDMDEADPKTGFHLKMLDQVTQARLLEKLRPTVKGATTIDGEPVEITTENIGELNLPLLTEACSEIVAATLVGWDNFQGADGKDRAFRTNGAGGCSPWSLRCIPGDAILELATKSIGLNSIGASQAKN